MGTVARHVCRMEEVKSARIIASAKLNDGPRSNHSTNITDHFRYSTGGTVPFKAIIWRYIP